MAPATPKSGRNAPAWQIWAALLTIYLVWGSTYLGIRVVVETMPPFLAAGIRFVGAGTILGLIVAIRSGPARLRVNRRELASALLIGLMLLCIGNGLVSIGEQSVPSGLAALVLGVIPLEILAIRKISGEHVSASGLVGELVGFVGLAVLIVPGGLDGSVSVIGMLALIVSSISWTVGSFISRRIQLPRDPLVSTVYQLLGGGLLLLAVAAATGESTFDPSRFSSASLVSLGYLILAGSVLAYSAYTWLLQHAPISRVSTYAYVNPVVAVALGYLILNEPISITTAGGAVLIVASVAFAIWAESRTRTSGTTGAADTGHLSADDPGTEVATEVASPG